MTTRYVYQRLKAPNDVNGNPRRLIVIYDLAEAGEIVEAINEGYGGSGPTRLAAVAAELGITCPEVQLPDVAISATEYRAWRRNLR